MIPSATQSAELDTESLPWCFICPHPFAPKVLRSVASSPNSLLQVLLCLSPVFCFKLDYFLWSPCLQICHINLSSYLCQHDICKIKSDHMSPLLKNPSVTQKIWSRLLPLICVRPSLLLTLGSLLLLLLFPPCLCYCWLFCLKCGLLLLSTPCPHMEDYHVRFNSDITSSRSLHWEAPPPGSLGAYIFYIYLYQCTDLIYYYLL